MEPKDIPNAYREDIMKTATKKTEEPFTFSDGTVCKWGKGQTCIIMTVCQLTVGIREAENTEYKQVYKSIFNQHFTV